ncbi:hypothetical protein PtB15_9B585 [Puccinia triticina]|nr:hypothetical protein PtB15_9B585 [Puccinia triticina]
MGMYADTKLIDLITHQASKPNDRKQMDMDLWWCPVCERAITEQEEQVPRPGLQKRATVPPTQPRYTSRGGVYAPKGSLYCSDACREVEELNGRTAFEQLAACLPALLGRPSPPEPPESDSTLSGTDELTSSRSVSLGRRPGAPAPKPPSSPSSDELPGLSTSKLALQRPGAPKDPDPPARRVPILLSPNGTPLIQPTFPHRPALGPHQRRHHSHYSPQKRGSPHSTVVRAASALKVGPAGVVPTPSASAPTYALPTAAAAPAGPARPAATTTTILNGQPGGRNDMQFAPDARAGKPTSLFRHYGLFFRPRPGAAHAVWADFADDLDAPAWPPHAAAAGMARQSSGPATRRARPHPSPVAAAEAPDPLAPARNQRPRPPAAADNPCRSWTWDHLPPDEPQYPAMDLAQIRLSKLLRLHQSFLPGPALAAPNPLNIRADFRLPGRAVDDPFPVVVQSKKKLFTFH